MTHGSTTAPDDMHLPPEVRPTDKPSSLRTIARRRSPSQAKGASLQACMHASPIPESALRMHSFLSSTLTFLEPSLGGPLSVPMRPMLLTAAVSQLRSLHAWQSARYRPTDLISEYIAVSRSFFEMVNKGRTCVWLIGCVADPRPRLRAKNVTVSASFCGLATVPLRLEELMACEGGKGTWSQSAVSLFCLRYESMSAVNNHMHPFIGVKNSWDTETSSKCSGP